MTFTFLSEGLAISLHTLLNHRRRLVETSVMIALILTED